MGIRREWALRTKGAMEAVLRADRNRRVYPHDPVMAAQQTDAETNLHTFVDGESPYHAMTAAMMAAFVEVRSLLEPYFTALEAWKANQSVGNRQALLERATAIQQLRRDARFDEQLVIFLLDKAGVSEATPGKT